MVVKALLQCLLIWLVQVIFSSRLASNERDGFLHTSTASGPNGQLPKVNNVSLAPYRSYKSEIGLEARTPVGARSLQRRPCRPLAALGVEVWGNPFRLFEARWLKICTETCTNSTVECVDSNSGASSASGAAQYSASVRRRKQHARRTVRWAQQLTPMT